MLDVLLRCTLDVVRLNYVRDQRVYRPWGRFNVRTEFNSCVRTASQSGGGDFGAWQIALSGASPKSKDRARHDGNTGLSLDAIRMWEVEECMKQYTARMTESSMRMLVECAMSAIVVL